MIFDLLCRLSLCAGAAFFCWRRILNYLRFLQQDEYSGKSLLSWWWKSGAYDRKGSAIALTLAFFSLLIPHPIWSFMAGAALALFASIEVDPRRVGKLTLKETERLCRIRKVAVAIIAVFLLPVPALLTGYMEGFALFFLFQALPFLVVLAKVSLGPGEARRQHHLMKQAKERWETIRPYTIGITGSFGKTSMKHAVGRLLHSCLGPTFWPEKGVNTSMGNTRAILGRLRRGTRYAVMEMGAYRQGSIHKLCQLTRPDAAIITGVGFCHLERFGDEESIFRAKSELAQAVPKDGILVCNGDNKGARRMAEHYPKRVTLLYGIDPCKGQDYDCWISQWKMTAEGTAFTLCWKGESYQGQTPLLGGAHLSNIAGAFTMACALGADPHYVLATIRVLEPVQNRLQVEKNGEVTYIHDAYNSNPLGFQSALSVMQALPAKRRILVTPGMIELGKIQEQENASAAEKAAEICDLIIPVGSTNRLAFLKGLQAKNFPEENIHCCDTRDEALARVAELRSSGDLILIENDLVDLHEHQLRF